MPLLRVLLMGVLVLGLAGWEPFKSPDEDVTAGNQAYADGQYDAAIEAYERARKRGVDGPSLDYNIGTAQLRKAEKTQDPAAKAKLTEDALGSLDRAAKKAADARTRAQASYNRGNAMLGQDKLEDAIKDYKQALKSDPSLEDARMNLELALKKREKKQQQQQQQGQGQGQPQQGQGQGQQQQQPQQGQGQGQQQQPQQGQGQGSQQQQQQGQGQGSQQQQQGQGQGSQQQQQQGQGQGSQQQQQQGQGQGSQQQQQQQGQGQGSQQQQQQQGQGQGSQQQQQQQQGQGQGSQQQQGRPGNPGQHYRGPRGPHPEGPQSPSDRKLDDLEKESRSMHRNQVRGQTWRGTWTDKDW